MFIGVVKERRAGRLRGPDAELFSGAFWSAAKSLEHGLIDGIADVRSKMREMYGPKVALKLVPISSGGLLSRLKRAPLGEVLAGDGGAAGLAFADELVSAVEARALWSRYGI